MTPSLVELLAIYSTHKSKENQGRSLSKLALNVGNHLEEMGYTTPLDINDNTAALYYKVLRCALNHAVSVHIIPFNPAPGLKAVGLSTKGESVNRVFLTKEELEKMIATPCGNATVKDAFLFSCFTGLRSSDIRGLSWGDINFEKKDQPSIFFKMQKTQNWIEIPLSEAALDCLPDKAEMIPEEKVFNLPTVMTMSTHISQWASDAGVKKHITMHVARHTFATLLLEQGVSLYVISRLLGHASIKTTEIYAEILDNSKRLAVNTLNNIKRNKDFCVRHCKDYWCKF